MRCFAALIALCVAGGTQAKPTDLFAPRYIDTPNRLKETREITARFGQCAVRRHRAGATEFVLELSLTAERRKILVEEVSDGYCFAYAAFDGVLSAAFPGDTMRYTLADALVRLEFPTSAVASFSHAPRLAHRFWDPSLYQPNAVNRVGKRNLEGQARNLAEAKMATFMSGFGECVVRSDPVGSHGLLMTKVTSAEETAQINRLRPALAGCIPKQMELPLTKASIRGSIALNYYRLAMAARDAVTRGVSQ